MAPIALNPWPTLISHPLFHALSHGMGGLGWQAQLLQLGHYIVIAVANWAILTWGFKHWVPRVLNDYGMTHFGWKRAQLDPFYISIGKSLLIWLLTFVLAGHGWGGPILAVAAVALLGTWVLDRRLQVIPNRFQWVGLASALSWLALHHSGIAAAKILVGETVPLGFLVANWVFKKLRGYEPMGLGDIKLLGWLALYSGATTWNIVIIACALACCSVLPRLLFRRIGREEAFAFGPYLVLAFVLNQLAIQIF